MNKSISFLIASVILIASVKSQTPTKYWVKLSDKNGTPYSISTPTAFLTQKAVQRRTAQGIAIDNTDLPVTPSYVSQIEAITDVKVLYASKWLNAVVVQIANSSTAAIPAINSLSFVVNSQPANKFKVVIEKEVNYLENTQLEKTSNVSAGPAYYGGAYWQAKQLNVDCMHGYGYRGQGMTIAVLDAGFRNVDVIQAFDSLKNRGGILGTRDFVAGGNSVYEDDSHGMSVLSCMAALVPNVMVGTAPRADYWLLRTEDVASETPSEEYNWIRGAEFADSVGVDILTTSLGYTTFDNSSFNHVYSSLNGKTYPMSIAATMAARKGIFVLNSAGNDGGNSWNFIGVPADADSICTVGAVDSLGLVTGFSSKGPTADGRIKPDLVARGGKAYVTNSFGGYSFGNGTSFSCPVLAGAVACFWQRHNTYSNMKVLDTLKLTASNKLNPNNSMGWGLPDMCALPVGIASYKIEEVPFSIYPNPFNAEVAIETESNFSKESTIEIYNVLGKKLFKVNEKLKSGKTNLNLSSLENGVYFIRLTNGNLSTTKKLVKE